MNLVKKILRPIKPRISRFLVVSKRTVRFLIVRTLLLGSMGSYLFGNLPPSRDSQSLGKETFISYNGAKAGFSRFSLVLFALFQMPEIHICILGVPTQSVQVWSKEIARKTQARVSWLDKTGGWSELRIRHLEIGEKRAVLLVDAGEYPPTLWQIVELLQASVKFNDEGQLGVVQPAYATPDRTVTRIGFDRKSISWEIVSAETNEYGQALIPRYVLNAFIHSVVISHEFIQAVLPETAPHVSSLANEFKAIVRSGWAVGLKALSFPQVVIPVASLAEQKFDDRDRLWLHSRQVTNSEGSIRIIFVLPAMTLSGGIRVVFEKVRGLRERGFEAEIWSLESKNAWGEIEVPITKFKNYESLTLALAQEDAIKVATWWETADAVFLGSVHRGTPVQFVQEFETWFYPNSALHRAAVVACYRTEFEYITTAEFQFQELEGIGIHPVLVPVGYDESIYKLNTSIHREADSIVAIGRPFFQKNFAMTLNAWKLIPEPKPRFLLFGNDGPPLAHEQLEYFSKPTNEQVNEIYNRGEIFVQTSRHEGFCLPIIEAMAAGCVVITTDSHGNRGFCIDGYNCVLVEQDDVAGLSATIIAVLRDKQLREKLRRNSLQTAEEYTWSKILDKYATAYKAIAEQG